MVKGNTPTPSELRNDVEAATLPENMGALLDRAAELFGSRLAWCFFERGEDYTFREIRELVNRAANALRHLGAVKGTRVAVMSTNVGAFPIAWIALAKLGAALVAINTRYTSREVNYILRDSDVDFLIIHEDLLPVFEGIEAKPARLTSDRVVVIGRNAPGYPHAWDDLIASAPADFTPADSVHLDDMVNIQYTSGTSGFPKGCMLTHRYWLVIGNVMSAIPGMPIRSALYNQNFFYMDGPAIASMCLYMGATFYFASRPSIAKFVDWIRKYKIEYLFFFEALYKHPETPLDGDNSLKLVHTFGFNRKNHADLERRFDVLARESYGMTEAGCILYMPTEDSHMVASGSCGIPAPYRTVMIASEEGTPVPQGEIGELWVRGPGIMLGYYNKPEANAECFRGGWFRTGDLFRQDEQGYYYIVGRKKDMVRRNAENVAAREVEEVLRGIPEVKEAAVIPVPDDRVGEEVKAYIQLQAGLTTDDLPPERIIDYCKRQLASFKIPRYVEYRNSFPMTDSDRVEKKKLIADVADLRLNSYDRVDRVWR